MSDQLTELLRQRIFRRTLRPGERLVESNLCDELQVSRAPLREALLRLEREGLVETRPHRGAVVVEVSEEDEAGIAELRIALESIALRRAAETQDPALIEKLERELSRMNQFALENESTEAALAHVEFHRILGHASGNKRLQGFIEQLTSQSLALRAYTVLPPAILRDLGSRHDAILDVIRSGESDRAGEVIAAHILAPSDLHARYRSAVEAESSDAVQESR